MDSFSFFKQLEDLNSNEKKELLVFADFLRFKRQQKESSYFALSEKSMENTSAKKGFSEKSSENASDTSLNNKDSISDSPHNTKPTPSATKPESYPPLVKNMNLDSNLVRNIKERLSAVPIERRTFFTQSLEHALPLRARKELENQEPDENLWRGEFLALQALVSHREVVETLLRYFKV